MSKAKLRPEGSGPGRSDRSASILAVLALTAALLVCGAFEPLENRLTTLRAQLLDRAPTGQVAIVEIDAKSLAKLSTWPWSRRYHAQALDRLHSAGAAIVAFDVDFSSASEPAGDRAFAEALRRAPATILPIFQQRASDDPSEGQIISAEPAPLFNSAWVGGVNIFAGPDGVVRDYPAATMIGGQIRPSIAALVAENDDFGDRTFQPDWAIDAQRIPRFSFVDMVEGRVPPDQIAGKRVLIGATAIELGDRYTIPRFGIVPGVVIQALAADSLLQDRAMTRSGLLPTLFGIGLVALLLGAVPFRRFNRGFPVAAGTIVAALCLAPVAIQARWPLSVDSAAILFCSLGCIAVRIFLEVRRRVRLSALVDSETGLANGRALEAALAGIESGKVILAAAAIDRFEQIRSAIGPDALTDLLRDAAARIEAVVGRSVYRIAPDILAWSGQEPDRAASAMDVAERFREPVQTREGSVDVRLTIGMDNEPVAGNARLKIERALAAIASARAAGETYRWYQASDPALRRQLSMMGELRRGMANGEVSVAYQPKLDIRTGRIAHAEALVRWRHPVDGAIPPDLFIPLAESTGVIRELTQFVLRRVVADLARLKPTDTPMSFAVNVSAADLGSSSFVDEVTEAIRDSGANPLGLTLEVTESAIISSPETAISVLTALRERGVQLAVDDYGTGQSTLTYLKQLPVNELKIDKSFVTSICRNENDRIMVHSTIDLAHQLGLRVVAEGVEDDETLCLLRSLGCDYAQGYFIGRAVSLEELCRLAGGETIARRVA
jgi:EAL domain-containing protein (putative c-di-GMP-specific phosphodiesterase class I)/CHASE2 domain-containing sensor protein/GGDEF domain-containing protein